MNIAVAITTAPREHPTLEWSLQSLLRAGFNHLHIYNDAENNAWQNWLGAARGLLDREPSADWLMVCQDDAIYCAGLREYLEGLEGKADGLAFASPWCPGPYRAEEDGWHVVDKGWKMCGAVCLVFPRQTLAGLVAYLSDEKGNRQIDAKLGRWARQTGRTVLFHTPSLVQHIGNDSSTVGRKAGYSGTREAADFIGVETTPEEAMTRDG